MSDTLTFEDRIKALVVEVLRDLGLVPVAPTGQWQAAPAPESTAAPVVDAPPPVVDATPMPQEVLGAPVAPTEPTVGV